MTRLALPRRRIHHALARLAADPHVLLAIAIAVSALVIELSTGAPPRPILATVVVLVAVQVVLALIVPGRRSAALDTARLLVALAAVWGMNLQGTDTALPLTALFIPIVAMGAVLGTVPMLIVGAAGIVAYLAPVLTAPVVEPAALQRGATLVVTMVVIAIGSRRTVSTLERAVERARAAMAQQRRRGRQLAAVETVGRVLAADGPTPEALDEVVGTLSDRFGYRYVSIFTLDGELLRVGAARGYSNGINSLPASRGVTGRVARTGLPALIRDVTQDPDYYAADPDVRSEISVPLMAHGPVLGVLNVESVAEAPLDAENLATLVVVADRISAALELGRQRQALADRAALFTRLAELGSAITSSLDRGTANVAIAEAIARAFEVDLVTLVVRDEATGEDRVVATSGGDRRYLGVRILPGDGLAGRAIEAGQPVRADEFVREDFASTLRGSQVPDAMAAAAVPISGEDGALGAILVGRRDLSRPVTDLELEGLTLTAVQVGLALRNIALHAKVADAAIRDALTGLWNRRHLEDAVPRLFAARARLEPEVRRPIAAILFDLDHFGAFNKQHGHAVGDQVLRAFGAILRGRLRASDYVARYGGEEFVAVLDGASLDEARRVADEVRRELEAIAIEGSDGMVLHATVSAGCASLGPDVVSYDALLEVADVALQMAKRGGRNQVVAA